MNLDSRLRGNDDSRQIVPLNYAFSLSIGERKLINHFVVKVSSGEPFELAQDMLGASLMQESKMQRN